LHTLHEGGGAFMSVASENAVLTLNNPGSQVVEVLLFEIGSS
jgi:hypothetical protein